MQGSIGASGSQSQGEVAQMLSNSGSSSQVPRRMQESISCSGSSSCSNGGGGAAIAVPRLRAKMAAEATTTIPVTLAIAFIFVSPFLVLFLVSPV
jgi:hypothetical protein